MPDVTSMGEPVLDQAPRSTSTLQQLRVFLVLGEELHFGRAAERLVLSQPYVSRTLAALEGRVGGKLMERTSRRVSLTRLRGSLPRRAEHGVPRPRPCVRSRARGGLGS